ncbi:MAG: dNTP triphosphohydrolase [Rhizobiales bacterium]|nr:dNTP triphosphohydrolase [Hyphomicrobiales bacterium]
MACETGGFGGGRAAYASNPETSRGRLISEPASPTRTDFQRDRDRILHSTAFRRLREKTQVCLGDEGDPEALALAHDLGHPPFGHAGERALNQSMAAFGGFDHNAQSVRAVTLLERRYPRFDGLNLTWETIEGLVKHNGPLTDAGGTPVGRYAGPGVPPVVAAYPADLWLWSFAGPEAQVAAIADDIAYDAHDIDDGLRSGLLHVTALEEADITRRIIDDIHADYPGLDAVRTSHELTRRLVSAMVDDVVAYARARLDETRPGSADDIRRADGPLVAFSPAMAEADRAIKAMLTRHVYRNPAVIAVMSDAEAMVRRLFRRYCEDPAAMPPVWRPAAGDDAATRALRVCDFLAGMTDRYAASEYGRLFGGRVG